MCGSSIRTFTSRQAASAKLLLASCFGATRAQSSSGCSSVRCLVTSLNACRSSSLWLRTFQHPFEQLLAAHCRCRTLATRSHDASRNCTKRKYQVQLHWRGEFSLTDYTARLGAAVVFAPTPTLFVTYTKLNTLTSGSRSARRLSEMDAQRARQTRSSRGSSESCVSCRPAGRPLVASKTQQAFQAWKSLVSKPRRHTHTSRCWKSGAADLSEVNPSRDLKMQCS